MVVKKGVDLSGLDSLAGFGDMSIGGLIGGDSGTALKTESNGKPRLILLSDIDEDPNQPRKEFSESSMQEMEDSIQERGVKTPVSVRANPDRPGRWILNYGARRYRGSRRAGKLDIPAFIDEAHEDYDQVIENLQREDLAPMELARFIARKVEEGEKKGAIAKKLGKHGAFVSRHLALLELPAKIMGAYDSGLCRDPDALYLLSTNYGEWCDEIDALIDKGEFISQPTTKAFLSALVKEKLAGEKQSIPPATTATTLTAGAQSAVVGNVATASASNTTDSGSAAEMSDETGAANSETPKESGQQQGAPASTTKPTDPDRIKKPIVQVFHHFDSQSLGARLLLDRRVTPGLAIIKYDHDGSEETVDVGALTISAIVEGAA